MLTATFLVAAAALILTVLLFTGALDPLLVATASSRLVVAVLLAFVLLLFGVAAYALRAMRLQAARLRQLELELAARTNEDIERSHRILKLEQELQSLQRHHGLLAMCSWCKSIRDAGGEWSALEPYLERYLHAAFTHGVCPECMRVEYPGLFEQEQA